MNEFLTRRGFARGVASALGACVVAPALTGASAQSSAPAAARPHGGMPPGTVRIDSNENPYGPSPKALEAMSDSQKIAARYPDARGAGAGLGEAARCFARERPSGVRLGRNLEDGRH